MPAYRLGKTPKHDAISHPRLLLSDHLRSSYSGYVPDNIDYSNLVDTWPMYLNDQLGDCTAADAGHGVELWTRYGQGQAVTVSDDKITSFYSGSTGYVPGDPSTDQGGNLQDVCSYFQKTGLDGHRIVAFFEVNPADATELRTALYLFGGVSVGLDFPAFAMDQFNAGQPWDVSRQNAQIEGGHDVLLVGMTKGGNYKVITWGAVQEVTPAFWKKYMCGSDGEAWARVSEEWINATGAIPAGLDVASANAAYQQLTGKPGPFAPPPAPTPTPVPTPVPTPSPVPAPPPPVNDPDLALLNAINTWTKAKGYYQ